MRRLFFGLTILIIILIGYAPSARADTPISNIRIDAQLQTDGTVQVVQTLQYVQAAPLHWRFFSNLQNLQVKADGLPLKQKDFQQQSDNLATIIETAKLASQWQINYLTTTTLIRHNNRDQVYFHVFEEPNVPIYSIFTTFKLPPTVQSQHTGLDGNVYSIGGSVGATTQVVSPTEVDYQANYAGPQSLFTFSASWNKSVLTLTPLQEARLSLSNLDVLPWLALGVFLPLLAILVLLRILINQKLNERKTKQLADQPPSQLSPILVGVLVNKKVYPEEIVALLIDLCQRGYLIIMKKINHYYLGQRKPPDEHLAPWERDIMEQLFLKGWEIDTDELSTISSDYLFSPKIRDAYSQIYNYITDLHFFAENPHLTRVKFKLFALGLYFASAIGLIWTAVSSASPYLIIPLAGTMLVAQLIIKTTPALITYTKEGQTERLKWLAFANTLSQDQPLPIEMAQNRSFDRYLPYAIVLHKTSQWAHRFDISRSRIVRPDWFASYEDTSTTEFAKEITEFTAVVSKIIAALRGPIVN